MPGLFCKRKRSSGLGPSHHGLRSRRGFRSRFSPSKRFSPEKSSVSQCSASTNLTSNQHELSLSQPLVHSNWFGAGALLCALGSACLLTNVPSIALVGSLLIMVGCVMLLACAMDWSSRSMQADHVSESMQNFEKIGINA